MVKWPLLYYFQMFSRSLCMSIGSRWINEFFLLLFVSKIFLLKCGMNFLGRKFIYQIFYFIEFSKSCTLGKMLVTLWTYKNLYYNRATKEPNFQYSASTIIDCGTELISKYSKFWVNLVRFRIWKTNCQLKQNPKR